MSAFFSSTCVATFAFIFSTTFATTTGLIVFAAKDGAFAGSALGAAAASYRL